MTDVPQPAQPALAPPRFQTLRTIMALMLREMSTTYGASPGGYIWAVLQPVGMLIVLSIGFSLLLRAPSLGTSFLLFYASGFLPFSLYSEIAQKTGSSLRYARALLAYPAVTWIDAVLARFCLNLLTGSVVFCIVMAGVLAYEQTRAILDAAPILNALLMAALLGLGVGMCNAVLAGLYPIWQNIWTIVTRPLFLASAILYIYEDLPEIAQMILWWNPLVHVTGIMRTGIYPTYQADYASPIFVYGAALVLIFLGLVFMRAYHTRVLEQR